MIQLLQPKDFQPIFGHLPCYIEDKIEKYSFCHRTLMSKERDRAILDMVKATYVDALPESGPARHPIWEAGWKENLDAFDPAKAGPELARPRYHNKHPIVRWMGDIYAPISQDYEYNMLALIGDVMFDRYLTDCTQVYEFGCGTGHNLFRVREVCPDATLFGMDWADSAVQFMRKQIEAGAYGPGACYAYHFDYFKPDFNVVVDRTTAFVTVASLEQVGSNWQPFVDFAIDKKPAICIHIEPIEEMLNPTVLLDRLSLDYFRKRNYLSGFLQGLHDNDKADVLKVYRTFIGSKFIEGYTVVVWRPKSE